MREIALPKEPKSIREQAEVCRVSIDAARADNLTAPTMAARKVLNQRIRMLEDIEKWLRSRAGYE